MVRGMAPGPTSRAAPDPPRAPGQGRERATGEQLERLVTRAQYGVGRLTEKELLDLSQLYRATSTEIARLEASDHDPRALARLRVVLARAHRVLYRPGADIAGGAAARAVRFLLVDSPAAIWAERKLLGAMLALFYGLCLMAYAGVTHDIELAYALQSAPAVDAEIAQLRDTAPGKPFRGNFTFGIGDSSMFSGSSCSEM